MVAFSCCKERNNLGRWITQIGKQYNGIDVKYTQFARDVLSSEYGCKPSQCANLGSAGQSEEIKNRECTNEFTKNVQCQTRRHKYGYSFRDVLIRPYSSIVQPILPISMRRVDRPTTSQARQEVSNLKLMQKRLHTAKITRSSVVVQTKLTIIFILERHDCQTSHYFTIS